MSYNLFLDDNRNPVDCVGYMHQRIGPKNPMYLNEMWLVVRDFNDFVYNINLRGLPAFISFDHDLAMEHTRYYFENGGHQAPPNPLTAEFKEKTGYDCAKWLIDYCINNNEKLPDFAVHSMNPVGSENITNLLVRFKQHQDDGRSRLQST